MVKCPWCDWEGTAEEYMRHYDEKHSTREFAEGPSQVIDALDKAIKNEREAISFYNEAYSRTSEPYEVVRLFRELALEEQEHLKRLQEVKHSLGF